MGLIVYITEHSGNLWTWLVHVQTESTFSSTLDRCHGTILPARGGSNDPIAFSRFVLHSCEIKSGQWPGEAGCTMPQVLFVQVQLVAMPQNFDLSPATLAEVFM